MESDRYYGPKEKALKAISIQALKKLIKIILLLQKDKNVSNTCKSTWKTCDEK